MINANELRIGNWVLLKSKPTKIESLNETGINLMAEGGYYAGEASFDFEGYFLPYFGNKTEIVAAIPITQDILVKCGFKFNNGIWGDGDDFELEFAGNAIQYWRDNTCYGIPLTSLHQLQNLYFSLTNKELNIEL